MIPTPNENDRKPDQSKGSGVDNNTDDEIVVASSNKTLSLSEKGSIKSNRKCSEKRSKILPPNCTHDDDKVDFHFFHL